MKGSLGNTSLFKSRPSLGVEGSVARPMTVDVGISMGSFQTLSEAKALATVLMTGGDIPCKMTAGWDLRISTFSTIFPAIDEAASCVATVEGGFITKLGVGATDPPAIEGPTFS